MTQIIDEREPLTVEIKQETVPTGQHYKYDTQAFDALAGQVTAHSFSYPISVSAEENTGDTWSWVIAPNTVVGALTSDVATTDTVISCSQTVIDNVQVGFFVDLFDGVNTDDLGEVLSKDTGANTLTISTAATQQFLASSPTYVRMSIYFLKDSEFGHPWRLVYGEGKIKSSYVPANTVIKVSYNNIHPTLDKRVVCAIELMY